MEMAGPFGNEAVDCGEVLGFASGQGSTKSPHSLRREGLLLMITLRAGESCYSPGPLRSRCPARAIPPSFPSAAAA